MVFSLPIRMKNVIGPSRNRNHSRIPWRLTLSTPLVIFTQQDAQDPNPLQFNTLWIPGLT